MDNDDKQKQEQEQEQKNKNVNIINIHVNCCDHKKDEDKKDWKNLYKKAYWDYEEGKYKEY